LSRKPRRPPDDYFVCRHCGSDVPIDAKSCRQCGSDDDTGWSQDPDVWQSDPGTGYGVEDDFDDDDYLERAHPDAAPTTPARRLARLALILLVAALVLAMLGL
jgi:hypothetical protein